MVYNLLSSTDQTGGSAVSFYFFGNLFYLLLRNPISGIIVILLLYLIMDRRFIGLIPDVFRPLRINRQKKNLIKELSLNPVNAAAQFELGSLLVGNKQYEKALPYLQKATEKLDNSQSHFMLGIALFRLGKQDDGREELLKALEMNPKVGYGEPYLYLAEYALTHKEDVSTVPGLKEALRQYGSAEVNYKLGRLFEKAGHKSEAVNCYDEAIAAYKQSPPFLRRQHRRYGLGAMLRRKLI
jgi:tetratricopeptide (TPR) repeat protein